MPLLQSLASLESLACLGIPWTGSPSEWRTIPPILLPVCSAQGQVSDASGIRFTLKFSRALGEGTFGKVDAFTRIQPDGAERQVALKRPKHPGIEFLLEALVQWRLRACLEDFSLGFCIPQVYDIFRDQRTTAVWFTMEAYEPCLLSAWILRPSSTPLFGTVLLQIALVLEVLEKEFLFDHRDLKVNNILIVERPVSIDIEWKGQKRTLHFPFHIVLVDFGFSCQGHFIDIRSGTGLPPLDPCPKVGRDFFQILVSLWSVRALRENVEGSWGAWIRACLGSYVTWIDRYSTIDWMYTVTDQGGFTAPRCAPSAVIGECMTRLERGGT